MTKKFKTHVYMDYWLDTLCHIHQGQFTATASSLRESKDCLRASEAVLINMAQYITGLILGLRPANERRRYKVTPSLIGWAQT